MSRLVDVRCPFSVRTKTDSKVYQCNKLIVRVYAPAGGEGYCNSCKLSFDFEVDGQNTYKPGVKVKNAN